MERTGNRRRTGWLLILKLQQHLGHSYYVSIFVFTSTYSSARLFPVASTTTITNSPSTQFIGSIHSISHRPSLPSPSIPYPTIPPLFFPFFYSFPIIPPTHPFTHSPSHSHSPPFLSPSPPSHTPHTPPHSPTHFTPPPTNTQDIDNLKCDNRQCGDPIGSRTRTLIPSVEDMTRVSYTLKTILVAGTCFQTPPKGSTGAYILACISVYTYAQFNLF